MYEGGYNGAGFDTELTDADFAFHYTVAGDENMTLRSSMFLGAIEGAIQPENEYIVAWLTQGAATFSVDNDDTPLVVGLPAMFPTGKQFVFKALEFKESLIHFNAAFLERVAAEHESALPGPIMFDHTAPPDPDALTRWKHVVSETASLILKGDPSPLQMAELDRRTAITLLDTFAHGSTPLPPELLLPRNGRLREAVEYMHTNANLPVTPTEIAETVGLSSRGLQLAFQRQFGVTPTEYLRAIRLDRVRAELAHLSEEETTIGTVAARWGFTHASRFAGLYAHKFGEYPRDTLRAAR